MNWGEKFVSAVDALVMIKTPIAERLSRIKKREEIRFGARVLPGGDMFEQQRMFSEIASKRSEDTVTENAEIFDCPKITIDGTMTFEKEMETVLGFIHELVLDK